MHTLEKHGRGQSEEISLRKIEVGGRARIQLVAGADVVRKHLGALGFVPGAIVRVVQMVKGDMILGIHDSRIAINGALAERISVVRV